MHTVTDNNSVWVANPNATDSNATFADATFFVSSASHAAGFLGDNSTATNDEITSGFSFYGHTALLVDASGVWQSAFYAMATETDGLWSLGWNFTNVNGAIPVTLRDTSPPKQP